MLIIEKNATFFRKHLKERKEARAKIVGVALPKKDQNKAQSYQVRRLFISTESLQNFSFFTVVPIITTKRSKRRFDTRATMTYFFMVAQCSHNCRCGITPYSPKVAMEEFNPKKKIHRDFLRRSASSNVKVTCHRNGSGTAGPNLTSVVLDLSEAGARLIVTAPLEVGDD